MKLTSTQIEQTLGQFEAEPIPEGHPMRVRAEDPAIVRPFLADVFAELSRC